MLPSGVFNRNYQSDMAILRTKTQWVILAVAILFFFTVPFFANPYWLSFLTTLGIIIVAVMGLHILSGLCGQFSIAQAALVVLGAYAAGLLAMKGHLNPWLCLPLSGLIAGLIGTFFGLPAFKLKHFYLVVSTMAASFVIVWVIQYLKITGGFGGMAVAPLKIGSIDLSSGTANYCMIVAFVIAATFFAKNIQRTVTGRAFVAIRDNELAAEVSGVPVFRYKMLAFFIGSAFAGVAGWLWAYSRPASGLYLLPNQFSMNDSMWWIGILVIGGFGSTSGVFFGAVFLRTLDMLLTDHLGPSLRSILPGMYIQISISMALIVNGIIIVLFMVFEPRGLASRWERLKVFYRLHPYSYWGG
jgi:branched-chain amino acid transport system permease protein